jgi:integrase
MRLVLRVPPRAVMDVMDWSSITMTKRYQHVPDELRALVAGQVGSLLWGEGETAEGANETGNETERAPRDRLAIVERL